MTIIHRRSALTGLAATAATALAAPAWSAENTSPIAHGLLENNQLALAFEKPAADKLPDVEIAGPDGVKPIADLLQGRTILMPLWAEWCAPCLSEIPDFAMLQRKYGGPKFAVVAIMTGAMRKWTPETIAQMFGILHAPGLTPLIENHFGGILLRKMARQGQQVSLPCNLLIAPDGHVVAREIGRVTADKATEGAAPPPSGAHGDPETIRRAAAGQAQSVWGEAAGERFAAIMAAGFFG